tara:strand:- start:4049 stop:4150 length:102 start_codon:yes stop_codon:yes gene_type:complete
MNKERLKIIEELTENELLCIAIKEKLKTKEVKK